VTGVLTIQVAAPSTTLTAFRISTEHPLYAVVLATPSASSNGAKLSIVLAIRWALTGTSGLASIFLLLFPRILRRAQLRAAFGLALLCVLSFTLGCGGGSSGSGGGGGTQVASHTTLTVTNAKQPATNNNFAFNVSVTSPGANPTGQVQLFEGSAALGLPVAISNGTASINAGFTTVGTHSVSVHYLGNTTTLPSASSAMNLTVTGSTAVPLTTAPSGSASINLTIQ
jgi:hypothetical protein